ncbi:6-bladed beta-propeller protein [Marinoscillum furvescens DSM 4134]|uniref:6-bladed beta-propeller protein n=2 Tax=Marinoscillum furvescens TaxID=1026 RepID=A0A3D9L221_MARFU|nr:6-bladed beta-propeller protein [Marinoscillum furvescens DSM 4134]
MGFLLLCLGCSQYTSSETQNEVDESTEIVNIDLVTNKIISLDSILEPNSIEFIALETTDESLIGGVDKIFFADSSYIIYDGQLERILKFKNSGSYERKIGRLGKGIMEYTQIRSLFYNQWSNTMDLMDVSRKLIQYDVASGEALEESRLVFDNFSLDAIYPAGKELSFLYNNFRFDMNAPEDTLYRLFFLNKNKVEYMSFPYPYIKDRTVFPTSSMFNFYTYQNKVHFFEPFNSVVYLLTENGPTPKYNIQYEFSKSSYESRLENLLTESLHQNRTSLNKVMETDKYLFLEFSEIIKGQKRGFRRFSLYDKHNRKCIANSIYSFFIEELALEVFLHQLSDNSFIAVVPAGIIIKYQKAYKEVLTDNEITPMKQKVLNLTVNEFDNPILLLMKIR